MKIVVSNLVKSIDRHCILDGVDMDIQPSAVNVIIGPNGAGKTTLLRIIGLLDKPGKGQLFLNERRVESYSSKELTTLRRKIGFVFQHPLILEGSVYRNMAYGLRVRKLTIDKEKIEAMLIRVGLNGKGDMEAKKLSGGEKQRLQLARIMLLDTELFLMDEPTANLDPISTRTIEMLVQEIVREGKTVVLSTHNLVQARILGHKFFFMKQGRVIQEGPAQEIFNRPVSLDIAEFSSAENIIYGKIVTENNSRSLNTDKLRICIATSHEDGPAAAVIRPEDILLSNEPIVSSARNSFKGRIILIMDMGIFLSVSIRCEDQIFISFITRESANMMDIKPGQPVYITFKSTAVHIIKK